MLSTTKLGQEFAPVLSLYRLLSGVCRCLCRPKRFRLWARKFFAAKRRAQSRLRTRPSLEDLEPRQMLTGVQFANGVERVNETAGSVSVPVVLDTTSS